MLHKRDGRQAISYFTVEWLSATIGEGGEICNETAGAESLPSYMENIIIFGYPHIEWEGDGYYINYSFPKIQFPKPGWETQDGTK